MPDCPLCNGAGGQVLHQAAHWRLVLAHEPDWPGLVRLIWTEHVAEWSDLSESQALTLWTAIHRVERVLRQQLAPDKVNVASLGNFVPHLHVHLIPRWLDDATFPASIWSSLPVSGPADPQRLERAQARRQMVRAQEPGLCQALTDCFKVEFHQS